MHILACILLFGSFLLAIAGCMFSGFALDRNKTHFVPLFEKAAFALAVILSSACLILFNAFARCDFTFQYVADYSATTLPLFYRVTAFWAGQAGSLLFWAWAVTFFCMFFRHSSAYERLADRSRLFYWLFHFGVLAFFLFLLCTWNNPFETASPAPAEGNGLNPLLQNPGMIFHPPLLFLGYAGLLVPALVALVESFSGECSPKESWAVTAGPFLLVAWAFLSAGIILGCWWSYMELGWGGYWAWDPVENASLIPWLLATAFLHTRLAQIHHGTLPRFNTCLVIITAASTFFATYLVRGNVVRSLHAFGGGGIALPLLVFVLLLLHLIRF